MKTWRIFAPLVLTLLAYGPVLKVGFLVEDHPAIEQNPHLSTWSWQALRHDFSDNLLNIAGTRHYRPALTFLNRLDLLLWGRHPLGFHVTSLLLHLGCVYLGFLLIEQLTGSSVIALLAAIFFGIHPIGVHTQLIVMAREEPLSFFWILATLWMGLRKDIVAFWGCLLFYAIALFSKESAVMTPFALVLILWCTRADRSLYRRAFWMILLTIPYLLLRRLAVGPVVLSKPLYVWKILLFKVSPALWWNYLGLLLWPWTIHYPHVLRHLTHFWMLCLVSFIALGYWTWQQENRFFFWCWAWSSLWLLPRLPAMVEQGSRMDHWAYPGALAFCALMAWLIAAAAHGLTAPKGTALFLGVLSSSLILYWTLATRYLIEDQKNDEALHRRTLRFEPDFGFSLFNLGCALLTQRKNTEAAFYLKRYIALYPDYPEAALAQHLLKQIPS